MARFASVNIQAASQTGVNGRVLTATSTTQGGAHPISRGSTSNDITIADSQQVNTASSASVSQGAVPHSITIANSQQVNQASQASISSSPATPIGSLSDADIARIVSALLVALNADPIPVNIKKVNNIQIKGVGTRNDPWNPI